MKININFDNIHSNIAENIITGLKNLDTDKLETSKKYQDNDHIHLHINYCGNDVNIGYVSLYKRNTQVFWRGYAYVSKEWIDACTCPHDNDPCNPQGDHPFEEISFVSMDTIGWDYGHFYNKEFVPLSTAICHVMITWLHCQTTIAPKPRTDFYLLNDLSNEDNDDPNSQDYFEDDEESDQYFYPSDTISQCIVIDNFRSKYHPWIRERLWLSDDDSESDN